MYEGKSVHLTPKMNSVLLERLLKMMKDGVNFFSISISILELFVFLCFFWSIQIR